MSKNEKSQGSKGTSSTSKGDSKGSKGKSKNFYLINQYLIC
jgi:hypothetical protein